MRGLTEITSCPYYFADKDGNIYSTKTGKLRKLSLFTDERGYFKARISKNGKVTNIRVHRLILETFVGSRPSGMCCAHLDGNKNNNKIENLKWTTYQENNSHKFLHGTVLRRENHPLVKLNWEKVHFIRDRTDLSVDELAMKFNVTRSCIQHVRQGTNWKEEGNKNE